MGREEEKLGQEDPWGKEGGRDTMVGHVESKSFRNVVGQSKCIPMGERKRG